MSRPPLGTIQPPILWVLARGYSMYHVMCMTELQTYVQKIGDNINIEITRIFRSCDLYDIIDKLVFMTDKGVYKAVIFSVHSEHCIGTHNMGRQWGRK